MYKLLWKNSAKKELRSIPKHFLPKIIRAVEGLENEPHPKGSKKLTGSQNTYRIRIGDYRVIYNLFEQNVTIEVIRVRHRKDVYK